ncbi:MAG: peroxiredoxin [Candidatus Micrarchaeota archaeon]|nr:peroxiredoxin [Candidatus Micrarchaeota archaeon]
MVNEMDDAPAFILPDADGKEKKLSDFYGKWLVLYFYPKDDTPGCTVEACGFRDMAGQYEKIGAQVVGISPDPPSSHKAFSGKYRLPFTLLSDSGGKVAAKYGAWAGKMERTTFIISPDGKIMKIFRKVKPEGHEKEVLDWLKKNA